MRPTGLWVWLLATGATLAFSSGTGRAQPGAQDSSTQDSSKSSVENGTAEMEPGKGLVAVPVVNRSEPPLNLPQFVRERILLFNQKREEYLAQHLGLIRQLRDAAEARQAQLRELVSEQREAWLQHGGGHAQGQTGVRLEGLNTEFAGQATEAAGELRQEPVFEPELEHQGTE